MSKPDLSKLNFAELQELAAEARSLAEAKRGEELKVLVDGWAKKAQAQQFDIAEVIEEFKHYLPSAAAKKTRAARGSKAVAADAWVKDVVYADPKGAGKDWRGGQRGSKPAWLVALVPDTLSLQEQTAKYASLAKK
ncbi:MAG: H-NS histone family protein [Betaproteobacteria bacterium]|nr:H-NS histone family protein [Betaproteobacteria bacterium]